MQYFSSCWQAWDSPSSPSLQMLFGPSHTQQVKSFSLLQNGSVQMLALVTGSWVFASITFTAGSWPRSKLFFLVYIQFLKYCLASVNVGHYFFEVCEEEGYFSEILLLHVANWPKSILSIFLHLMRDLLGFSNSSIWSSNVIHFLFGLCLAYHLTTVLQQSRL